MGKRKSWTEKLITDRVPVVEICEKDYAGIPGGEKMLISTPIEVERYISQIPKGTFRTLNQLRTDMAAEYGVDYMCPLTSGIFVRIVAEAANERLQAGQKEICPYWRVVAFDSPTATKLTFGKNHLAECQRAEFGGLVLLKNKQSKR